jgi:hypothetical protein
MSEEIIDHYVDRAGVSDDTKFITGELKQVLDLFDKVNSKKINLGGAKGMKDISTAAKELKGVMDSLQKTAEAYNKTQLQEAKLRKENALSSKAEAQARKENAAAAIKEKQALDESGKEREKEKQRINEIGRAYIEYSKAAREASLKAKAYALTLGESNPVTLAAVKNAKEMNDILLRVDKAVGQNQRNVGNYKSAFDGLSVSFSQVARELPSLAVSAQTFALAISNNLPMVFDEIKKARVEIAALKAEGQAAPTLFQRIGASLISWNIGLSIGIALITTFSGKIIEWVSGLFDSEAATKKAAKAQQDYNKNIEEAIELNERYYKDIKRFGEDSVNRKLENDLLRARALGKSEKEILEIERQIAVERATIASQEFFSKKGEKELSDLESKLFDARYAYQQFLDTIRGREVTEKEKTTAGILKDDFELAEKAFLRQKKVVEDYYNANRDLELKDLELQKLAAEQRIGFFAEELQYRAEILKNISQLEDAERITRLNARKQALENEKAIIEGQYQDEIFAAKNNQIKIFEVNREYKFKRKKLEEEYARDVLAIRQTSLQRQRELDQQYNDQFREDDEARIRQEEERAQKKFDTSVNYLNEERDYRLKALEAERNAKIKSASGDKERQEIEEKYNRKRKQIELDTNIAIIQSSLAIAEAKLKIAQQTPGVDESQISGLKAAIAQLKKELEKLKGFEIDIKIDDAEAKLRKLQGQISDVSNKINDGFNAIGSFVGNDIDRRKNAIQEEIDLIEERKAKDIEAINASAATQQEKAAAIAIIEAKAAANSEALERRQRALELQRARFEKAKNIAQAVGRAALAVLEGLIAGGPVLAAIYGAIGAAQVAVAIAQPLPRFKHGRKDGPATLGVVGDGGVQEVIYSPDLKHAMVTPDTDTLAYIPKGYGVAPSLEEFQKTAMKMAHNKLPVMPFLQQNNNDDLIHAMAYSIGRLERVIIGKQETHFHWNNGELQKSIKKGNDWWRYIQNNI